MAREAGRDRTDSEDSDDSRGGGPLSGRLTESAPDHGCTAADRPGSEPQAGNYLGSEGYTGNLLELET